MNGDGRRNCDLVYYQCYGKISSTQECTKRGIRKEFLEEVVLKDALSLLTDENIELIADTAVRANNKELEQTTNIPAYKTRLQEISRSLANLTRAIETGDAPEILVKRMVELEKEKRTLEALLKNEEKGVIYLDKARIIYWLEQFRTGDIHDEAFAKRLIDLFVNSVTVWDEPDDIMRITIAYNLTGNQKTYRLTKDNTSPSRFSHARLQVSVCIRDHILLHTIHFYQKPHHEAVRITIPSSPAAFRTASWASASA